MTKSRSLKGKGSALIAEKNFFSARKGSSIGEKRIFDRREKDLRSARKGSSIGEKRIFDRREKFLLP
ncbi:MAG: hypothetical protein AB4352_22645 [Hormoscilla sp.]